MIDLAGRSFLLTRTWDDAAAWARVIEERGGRVVHLPCILVETIQDPGTATQLRAALQSAQWLALTSRRGVVAVAELHPEPLPERVRIAAVGAATAEEARRRLRRCELVSGGSGRELARDLAQVLEGERQPRARVVIAAADRARRDLEEVLEPLGTWITRIAVYRTLPAPRRDPKIDLAAQKVDVVFLASPSAVQGFVNQVGTESDVRVITIGPTTTEAARTLGLAVAAEAARPDIEALLEAIG